VYSEIVALLSVDMLLDLLQANPADHSRRLYSVDFSVSRVINDLRNANWLGTFIRYRRDCLESSGTRAPSGCL
jgi:hypothetical protein